VRDGTDTGRLIDYFAARHGGELLYEFMKCSFVASRQRYKGNPAKAQKYFWEHLGRQMRRWEDRQQQARLEPLVPHLMPTAYLPWLIKWVLEDGCRPPKHRAPEPEGFEQDHPEREGLDRWQRLGPNPKKRGRK
jgi:hypothetical protein